MSTLTVTAHSQAADTRREPHTRSQGHLGTFNCQSLLYAQQRVSQAGPSPGSALQPPHPEVSTTPACSLQCAPQGCEQLSGHFHKPAGHRERQSVGQRDILPLAPAKQSSWSSQQPAHAGPGRGCAGCAETVDHWRGGSCHPVADLFRNSSGFAA